MSITPTDLSSVDVSGVRIVAIDMDGTLLNDAKEMPEGLWDVIRALQAQGIECVPASGRQYWTLRNLFAPVAQGMTIIAENGSVVMKDGEEIFIDGMDCDTAIEVVRRVREKRGNGANTGLVVCCAKSAYIERADAEFENTVREYYHHTEIVPDLVEHLEGMRDGRVDDSLLKLAQWAEKDIVSIAEYTMGFAADTHQWVVSGAHWSDLQEKSVNKGLGIEALQKALGVGPESTMSFGDFHNDIEMLERSEFSFAMANAEPEVIAVSNYVAPSNNDAGVVVVLKETFGL